VSRRCRLPLDAASALCLPRVGTFRNGANYAGEGRLLKGEKCYPPSLCVSFLTHPAVDHPSSPPKARPACPESSPCQIG